MRRNERMRNYDDLHLVENQEAQNHVRMRKWRLFFIGPLLFVFSILTFGDPLFDDIADYPMAFQKQLKDAQRAFQLEQWGDAFRLYRALAKEAPEFAVAYIGEGDAAAKLKDYPAAITAFQRALQLLSKQPQGDVSRSHLQITVQAKLAAAYHRNKQLDEADIWFQEAIKGAGEDAPVAWYVALGQIETERGNLEQARRYYIVAVQLHPDTTAAYNNLGHVLLKLNRIDEADAVFREALTQDETLASAAFGRGEVGARRGQLAVAQRFYQQAIRHAPDEPIFHKSLADTLRNLGNTKAAEAAETRYRRTLADRYLRQAHWFIEKKRLQRALEALQNALEADDTLAPGYLWRGKIYQEQGESSMAETDFRRAIQLAPDVPFPKEALASLLVSENRKLNEALVLAKTAVKSEGRPAHRATLALVYYRLNRVPDAQREIRSAFTEAPNHPYILKIRSEILKTDP